MMKCNLRGDAIAIDQNHPLLCSEPGRSRSWNLVPNIKADNPSLRIAEYGLIVAVGIYLYASSKLCR